MKIYFFIFFIFVVPAISFAQKKTDTLKIDSSKHLTDYKGLPYGAARFKRSCIRQCAKYRPVKTAA